MAATKITPRFIRGHLPMKLPEHHHHHDAQWLKEQLGRLPVRLQSKAIAGYDAAYKEAHDAEPALVRKENAARFAANTRLRKFVEKILASQRRINNNTCAKT